MKNDSFFLILINYLFLVKNGKRGNFSDSQIFTRILKNYPRDELGCSQVKTVISYNSVKKLWQRNLWTETCKSYRLKNRYKYYVKSVPRWQLLRQTCSSQDSFEKSNLSKNGSVHPSRRPWHSLAPSWGLFENIYLLFVGLWSYKFNIQQFWTFLVITTERFQHSVKYLVRFANLSVSRLSGRCRPVLNGDYRFEHRGT